MFYSSRSHVVFLLAAVFCAFLSTAVAEPRAATENRVDCSIAEGGIKIASKIRGLEVKKDVPCFLKDKKQVEQYLRSTIDKKYSLARIENEGRVFRMMGLLPVDYDYYNGLIELYTDQLGGYYEPKEDYYAMAAWMPAAMQMPIAVHELTHALQDQHFDLEKLVDDISLSSDEQLARAALVEGDATAVMLDYSHMLVGKPGIAESDNVSAFMLQSLSGAMFSSSLRKAPAAIQAALLFPYVSGLNFVHGILQKGGYAAVNQAFARFPKTTSEILHPELYLNDSFADKEHQLDRFKSISAPADFLAAGKEPVHSDTLGEFLLAALLGTWLPTPEASKAAAGWRGDRVALYEGKDKDSYALTWESVWLNEKEAEEFFQAAAKAYCLRYQQSKGTGRTETGKIANGGEPCRDSAGKIKYAGTPFGNVELRLAGTQVLLQIWP